MARANNGGWDFVKVGETYQYKEDGWIAMVKILEDNSTPDRYKFKLLVLKATEDPSPNEQFELSFVKDLDGYFFSGMAQFYENEEYICKYNWMGEGEGKIVTKINEIGNYYGSLHVKKDNGKYYTKVFCEVSNKDWEEITKELYDMLMMLNNK